jgi:hypothetical protein
VAGDRVVNFILKGHDEASSIFKHVYIDAVELFEGVVEGAKKIAEAFEGTIEKAREQDRADAVLASSLRMVHGATKDTFESLKKFASEMQESTGIEDQSIEKLLALFAAFGNTRKGMEAGTRAALDFAAATGIDAHAAALALQKASDGNTLALRRYGIQIDAAAAKSGGLVYVSEQVEQRFHGMASAAMVGVDGALVRVKNSFGDLQEVMGQTLTHSGDLAVGLEGINKALLTVVDWVEKNGPTIGTTLAKASVLSIRGFAGIVDAVGPTLSAINSVYTTTGIVYDGIRIKINQFLIWQKENQITLGIAIDPQAQEKLAKLRSDVAAAQADLIKGYGDGTKRRAELADTSKLLGSLADGLRDVADAAEKDMVGATVKAGAGVKSLGSDAEAASEATRKALEKMRAAYNTLDEDARLALGSIERELSSKVFAGWGTDQGQAIREVIAKYNELRRKIKETGEFGHDTTRAMALVAQAQAGEIDAVKDRFSKKAEKDLAKETKRTEKLGEDIGGYFGRGIKAAIQGDAQAIIGMVVNIFGKVLTAFGGAGGGIIGAILGGIFHEGSGNVASQRRPIYAHEGLSSLHPDERALIYRTPEAVLNQRGVAAAGGRDAVERMNRGYPMSGGGGVEIGRMIINVDGSRLEARDWRLRELGHEMRRSTRYGADEWSRRQRAAGLAPGR